MEFKEIAAFISDKQRYLHCINMMRHACRCKDGKALKSAMKDLIQCFDRAVEVRRPALAASALGNASVPIPTGGRGHWSVRTVQAALNEKYFK
jgi:hypothetical protein